MLFKNLKSGNFVEAPNDTSVELMKLSTSYEAVANASAARVTKAGKAAKKSGGKAVKATK